MSKGPGWEETASRLVEMKMRTAAEEAHFCLEHMANASGSPIEAALHRALVALSGDRSLGFGVSSHVFSEPVIFGDTLRWVDWNGYRQLEWNNPNDSSEAFIIGHGGYEGEVASWEAAFPGNGSIDIFPQARVGKYSVDLLVCRGGRQPNVLAVECDGHDFHEKTKEQARHDKRRDRAILASGIQTVRFAGSEIWKDATACAKEVVNLLLGSECEKATLAAISQRIEGVVE